MIYLTKISLAIISTLLLPSMQSIAQQSESKTMIEQLTNSYVQFCISNGDFSLDVETSCARFTKDGIKLYHTGDTNYFSFLNLYPNSEVRKNIVDETYNTKMPNGLVKLYIEHSVIIKTISAQEDTEPLWYLERLAECKGFFSQCEKNADKFDNFMGWFSFLWGDKYVACQTFLVKCEQEAKKILDADRSIIRKIGNEIIRVKKSSIGDGNHSGGSSSSPVMVFPAPGGDRCYGVTMTCGTTNGSEVCSKFWQEVMCQ